MGEDCFKYLSQKFDSKVLDLFKKKGFYPYEHMIDLELQNKEKFYSSFTGKKLLIQSMNISLRFGINLK